MGIVIAHTMKATRCYCPLTSSKPLGPEDIGACAFCIPVKNSETMREAFLVDDDSNHQTSFLRMPPFSSFGNHHWRMEKANGPKPQLEVRPSSETELENVGLLGLGHTDGQGRQSSRSDNTVLRPILEGRRRWHCLLSVFSPGLINMPLLFMYTIINKLATLLMEPWNKAPYIKNILLNLDPWVRTGCFGCDVISRLSPSESQWWRLFKVSTHVRLTKPCQDGHGFQHGC